MPDFAAIPVPDNLLTAAAAEALLPALLDISIAGMALYRPVQPAEDGAIIDFTFEYLNPAALQILRLEALPSQTYLQLYPHTLDTGVFAFHRNTFESGTPARFSINYQGDGLDNYFQLSARRVGELLLVSFTDTAHQPRTAVEEALRASQAREQATRADAEHQRNQLQAILEQAPVAIGFFEGPELVVTAANQLICNMWGYPPADVLGRPWLDAVPELRGQGFDQKMHEVARTGVPFVGQEVPAVLQRNGQLETTYYNFVYQPIYSAPGVLAGVMDIALDVTVQVQARQRLEHSEETLQILNEELAATNEELQAANEEFHTNNTALLRAQQELEVLNDALQTARNATEEQRAHLENVFMQAPAMICIFEGPQHVFTLANPLYQALVGDRPILGKTIAEAMPELAGQPIFDLLDNVYHTGETFYATEMLVQLDHGNAGVLEAEKLEKRYYNFIYQARRDLSGTIDGILVFANDVTPQVVARQRIEEQQRQLQLLNRKLEDTNEELAAANEELASANEEFLTNNTELLRTQMALRDLNEQLENRVNRRTDALQTAQAEAERQRARLERFFMQAPAPICILDGPEYIFELVNPAYQALFPGRTLLSKPLLAALPEVGAQVILSILNGVYQTGESFEGREILLSIARYEGEEPTDRYFDFIYQPRYDEHKQIDGILVFAFEMTTQVQARQLVERSQENLRLALEAGNMATFSMDLMTQLTERSEGHDQLFGYTETLAEWRLPALLAHMRPEDQATMRAQFDESLTSGNLWLTPRIQHPNGELRWLECRGKVFYDEASRKPVRIAGVVMDVTERNTAQQLLQMLSDEVAATNEGLRHANVELARTNARLTRTNEDLDNFVYTASHDLKQPVNNMAGIFEELKRTATFHDPDSQMLLGMFERSLTQIHHTIHGLTEVVQVERRTSQAPAEVVALQAVTEGVLLSLLPQAQALAADFQLDFSALPQLCFARLNLQSILYNLLHNALKYAHPDRPPVVLVSSRLTAAGLPMLTVQDNGLGIDLARYGDELFQMFHRFHDHVPGSGMGLYLVNRIVQQAGGYIEVASTVNEGTSFHLFFAPDAVPTT